MSASVCMKVSPRRVECPQWSRVLDKSSGSMNNSSRHGLADGQDMYAGPLGLADGSEPACEATKVLVRLKWYTLH